MQDGEEGTIAEIGEEIRDTVVSMGVRPGERLVIHNTQPLNGPVVVSVGQSMTSMSQSHARQIEISVDDD
ncbi:FeoA family protein [Halanaeroarchaeum sulfurireducens]|uniref:FeoA domain-containing protein n=1 Tax=Halanaeroarchaeum sulfurireducens TaxID=1604004 RepID=A0A0F7P5W5_9EURY|nr:FeoA family protein [Halanaeroarchaeum sulfurireducens]AKH96576.1 FeoA domain-containing protein [Halanaeroarchaeum sulfurireducens]ALG80978.1 FeoA domain-containing protein [Halanaeroarchaeum sulfurireducens]